MRYFSLFLCIGLWGLCTAQDLSNLDTAAYYSLIGTGHDATGHYQEMVLQNAPFAGMNGVYSNGIYINDTIPGGCLISTPSISALYDSVFAVRVEFRIAAFVSAHAVIVCGNGYRYLGLMYDNNGSVYTLFNNSWPLLPGVQLEVGRWYTLTIIHSMAAETSEYWLDDQLIDTRNGPLMRSDTDDQAGNTNFANGLVFLGHMRNLTIYSDRGIVSEVLKPHRVTPLQVYPNPAGSVLYLGDDLRSGDWSIYDTSGRLLTSGKLAGENDINISTLVSGEYLLQVRQGNTVSSAVVVK